MIRTYASDIGKDIYQGNWSIFASDRLDPLDDCFLDLRILDAAASIADVQRAFRGRLDVVARAKKNGYCIRAPLKRDFKYRIEFVWTASGADAVNVILGRP